MFSDSSGGELFPRGKLPSLLRRLDGVQPFSRHPWFFRFTGEGRIPSGCCPLAVAFGFGKFGPTPEYAFARLRGGGARSTGDPGEVRLSRIAVFPFSRRSATPFLSRLRAARVDSAVAFHCPRQGALFDRVFPEASQLWVSSAEPPFLGVPIGGEFRSKRLSRGSLA